MRLNTFFIFLLFSLISNISLSDCSGPQRIFLMVKSVGDGSPFFILTETLSSWENENIRKLLTSLDRYVPLTNKLSKPKMEDVKSVLTYFSKHKHFVRRYEGVKLEFNYKDSKKSVDIYASREGGVDLTIEDIKDISVIEHMEMGEFAFPATASPDDFLILKSYAPYRLRSLTAEFEDIKAIDFLVENSRRTVILSKPDGCI
jgi:hypothetical protein